MTDVIHISYQVDDSALERSSQKIGGMAGAAQQAAQQGGGFLSGLIDTASKVGFAIFGVQQSVQMLSGVFQGLVGGNLQFEQFQTKFEVMLGSADAAKERMKELADFGRTTPFELPGVVQASVVLETLTQGALATGDGLRLVGDVASGTGRPIEELAVWFGRMYDSVQSGRPVGEAMARLQELGAVSGELRGQIEGMIEAGIDGDVVWQTMVDGMDRYAGMMDKQSKTVGGALSNVADGIGALKRNLMAGAFEAAKPAIMGLATVLGSDGLQGAATKAGEAIGIVLAGAIRGIVVVAEALRPAFEAVGEIVGKAVGLISDGFEKLSGNKELLISLGIAIGTVLLPAVIAIGGALIGMVAAAAAAAAPFLLIGVAIAALTAGIYLLITNWDSITAKFPIIGQAADGVVNAFNRVKDVAMDAFGWLVSTGLPKTIELGSKAFDWVQSDALPAMSDFAIASKEAFADTFDSLDVDWGGMGSDISDAFAELGEKFVSIGESIQPFLDIWKELGSGILDGLAEAFAEIGKALGAELVPSLAKFGPAIEAALPILEALGKILGVTLLAAVTAVMFALERLIPIVGIVLVGAIQQAANIITGLAGMWEGAFKVIEGIWNTFKGLFTGDWDLFWKGIGQVFEGLGMIFESAIKAAFEIMKTNFETGWKIINELTGGKIAEFVEWFIALPGRIIDALGDLTGTLLGKGMDLLEGFWDGIKDTWNLVMMWLWDLGSLVVGAIGDLSGLLVDVGMDIVRGLWNGMLAMKDWLIGKLEELAGWIPGPIRDILGIGSPSIVMAQEVGVPIAQGIAMGIMHGANEYIYPTLEEIAANAAYLSNIVVAPVAQPNIPSYEDTAKNEMIGSFGAGGVYYGPEWAYQTDLNIQAARAGMDPTSYLLSTMNNLAGIGHQAVNDYARRIGPQLSELSAPYARGLPAWSRERAGALVVNINGGTFANIREFIDELEREFERRYG